MNLDISALQESFCWRHRKKYNIPEIKLTSIDEAVEIIAFTSKRSRFEQTPESETALGNLLLSAQVQSKLIEHIPTVDVFCSDKEIAHISCQGTFNQENSLKSNIRELLQGVQGIEKIIFKITQ